MATFFFIYTANNMRTCRQYMLYIYGCPRNMRNILKTGIGPGFENIGGIGGIDMQIVM